MENVTVIQKNHQLFVKYSAHELFDLEVETHLPASFENIFNHSNEVPTYTHSSLLPDQNKNQVKTKISNTKYSKSSQMKNSIIWKIPKCPIEYLKTMVQFAVDVYTKYQSEAQAFIIYNTTKKTFSFYIPKQEVSGATCTYDMKNFAKDEIIVANFHSHHTMGCGFSGTDDHDDISKSIVPTISIVLISIDRFNLINPNENFDIRLCIWGEFITLKIEDIFDVSVSNSSIPKSTWEPLVSKPIPHANPPHTKSMTRFSPASSYNQSTSRNPHALQSPTRTTPTSYEKSDFLDELRKFSSATPTNDLKDDVKFIESLYPTICEGIPPREELLSFYYSLTPQEKRFINKNQGELIKEYFEQCGEFDDDYLDEAYSSFLSDDDDYDDERRIHPFPKFKP